MNLRHGYYVAKNKTVLQLREQRIKRLVFAVKRRMPWLEPADKPAVRAWAELEQIGSAIYLELINNGIMGPDGKPRNDMLNHLRMYRTAQLAYENALGMTPAGRMSIKANGTSVALDLAGACAVEDGAEPEASEPAGVIDDKP